METRVTVLSLWVCMCVSVCGFISATSSWWTRKQGINVAKADSCSLEPVEYSSSGGQFPSYYQACNSVLGTIFFILHQNGQTTLSWRPLRRKNCFRNMEGFAEQDQQLTVTHNHLTHAGEYLVRNEGVYILLDEQAITAWKSTGECW